MKTAIERMHELELRLIDVKSFTKQNRITTEFERSLIELVHNIIHDFFYLGWQNDLQK
jgi:hypothetical protein